MSREEKYRIVVDQVARACVHGADPDRVYHRVMGQVRITRKMYRDTMEYGNHPFAWADLLGDEVESMTNDDWNSVVENITYMAFRGDVLERVVQIKEGTD